MEAGREESAAGHAAGHCGRCARDAVHRARDREQQQRELGGILRVAVHLRRDFMKTIKGPGIFLAQFAGDQTPFNTLDGMAGWAASLGYVGIQIPSWDARLFNLERAAEASRNLGLAAHATFSGALAWPFFYPWPQRPVGLIDEAFEELARLWLPILHAFDESGVDVCYELHPGEDLHDGA